MTQATRAIAYRIVWGLGLDYFLANEAPLITNRPLTYTFTFRDALNGATIQVAVRPKHLETVVLFGDIPATVKGTYPVLAQNGIAEPAKKMLVCKTRRFLSAD